MKKKALGKGLKAFLPQEYEILKDEKFINLDIDQLKPNPLQPRKNFDDESINDLARSMQKSGVLQPVLVVPQEDHYRIILGERRWRAAQRAGLKKIPAIIRQMPREQQLEASLIENLQREDLNPLEIAKAYQRMIQELNYTQQEVAEKVSKDRASVANYIRLLKLPPEIQDMVAQNKISMGHARALLSIENPELQRKICRDVVKKNFSVRELEKKISSAQHSTPSKPASSLDPDLLALQEELLKLLGTKVSISGNQKKGVLKIYYFSLDDLNRVYEKIKGVSE